MTPAIAVLKKAGVDYVVHEYLHDPANLQFGLEAATKLGVAPERVFKTLLVALNGNQKTLAVSVIPVCCQLDLKAMAKACKAKKAAMAMPAVAERSSGYVVGGISPLGQKKSLPTVIDGSAADMASMFVSGGRRGLDLELSPQVLARLCGGHFASLVL